MSVQKRVKLSDLKTFEEVLEVHIRDPEFKKEWDRYIEIKETILNAVESLVSDFLYYGRKEDEELPQGSIEKAIDEGLITLEEILIHFKEKLIEGLE